MIHRLQYRYLNSYLTFHFKVSSELLQGSKGGKQEKVNVYKPELLESKKLTGVMA